MSSSPCSTLPAASTPCPSSEPPQTASTPRNSSSTTSKLPSSAIRLATFCLSPSSKYRGKEEDEQDIIPEEEESSTSLPPCRICLDTSSGCDSRMLNPCKCAGSSGRVHRACLERWLSTANKEECEICGQEYNVKKRQRSASEWLSKSCAHPCTSSSNRSLLTDVFCLLVVVLPLCIASIWLCGVAGYYCMQTKELGGESSAAGLFALAAFCGFTFMMWLVLTIKRHWKRYKNWKEANQSIRLVEEESKA